MLEVDQAYDENNAFAGARIYTEPPGREIWAKPMGNGTVAAVLFNRAGSVVGTTPEGADPPPSQCSDPTKQIYPCHGCYVNDDRPWLAPCDDNATASTGAQLLSLDFATLPSAWVAPSAQALKQQQPTPRDCDVFDIYGETGARGKSLGRMSTFSAVVPPHGVRFLRLSGCQ
jgi:hypothetical protein